MNLIINLDHDDWILSDPEATLQSVGCGESRLLLRAARREMKCS